MAKLLPALVSIVLFVYAFFDLIATPAPRTKHVPKPLWFLIILVPVVGPLLWLFFGAEKATGGPERPPRGWRPPSKGPDDDPDYLRGL